MTAKQLNAAIDVFLVGLPVKYCDMLHHFFLHSSGILSPCIMCVCSTLGGAQYHGGVQYHGGYHDKCGGYLEYRGGVQYRGGYHEYRRGYLEYRGGYSVPWGIS